MPSKILTTGPSLTDEQVDQAASKLPPVADNVKLHLRHLQDQVTALTTRIEALEP